MMGEEPERLRAHPLAELEPAAMRCYERVKAALPASDPTNPDDPDLSLDTFAAILHAALSKRDALLAEVERLAGELDGPSGLREQLVAARKGEQIEFRLRKKAELLRDVFQVRNKRLAGERDDWIAKYEQMTKLADESETSRMKSEAECKRLAGELRTQKLLTGTVEAAERQTAKAWESHDLARAECKRLARRVAALETVEQAARKYVGPEPLVLYAREQVGESHIGMLADSKWVALVTALADVGVSE